MARRALPIVGLPTALGRLADTTTTQPDRPHPMVDPPRGPTAGVGVTVAELPGTCWERIRNDSSRLNGRRYRVADCRSGNLLLRDRWATQPHRKQPRRLCAEREKNCQPGPGNRTCYRTHQQ